MVVFSLGVVIPDKSRNGFLSSMAAIVEPTKVAPGCFTCRLFSDIENSNAFTLIEEWSSQRELDRYLASDACKTLIAVMEMSAEPPIIRFDEIARSAGIEVIESARGTESYS